MWQLRLQKADHAVRQAIDDQHENGAQDDAEIVRKRRDQHFEQQDERHGAEQRTEQRAGAAEQRHDHDLEGEHRVERDRRVDIGPARRHHRPGHGHEGGAHREQNELGAGRVDAAVAGDRLVLADDADGKAKPGVADQPAGDQYHDDERQQAPVDAFRGGVGEDVAPDRAVDVDFIPGDQLADELGQAEAEDHEIDSRQAQRRQADDQRHDDTDNSCRNEHHRPRQKIGEDGGRIGADAEEGCRREGDVMGRTRKESPGGRQHREIQKADGECEVIAARNQWKGGKRRDDDRSCGNKRQFSCSQRAGLPNRPVGRHRRTLRNSA